MYYKGKKAVCFCALLFFFFIFAHSADAIDTGLSATANTAGYSTGVSIQTYIGYGIQAVLGVVGAVLFAMLVYGGVMWMISEGDQTKIKKARDIITYAIIGIIIILGAYTVTQFITNQIATKALTT